MTRTERTPAAPDALACGLGWRTAALVVAVSVVVSVLAPVAAIPAGAASEPEVVSIGTAGTPYSLVDEPDTFGLLGGLAVSGGGDKVLFAATQAADLPCTKDGHASCAPGVWLRDRVTGTTIEVSTDESGNSLPADRANPWVQVLGLSAQGTTALFWLGEGPSAYHLYVKDLSTGEVILLTSVTTSWLMGENVPVLSGNGNTVFYEVSDGGWRAWDRDTGVTTPMLMSQPWDETEITDVSDDGTKVLWQHWSTDVDHFDAQVELLDRTTGVSRVVSNSPSGSPSYGVNARMSGNGRYVTYWWWEDNGVHQPEPQHYDLDTGQIRSLVFSEASYDIANPTDDGKVRYHLYGNTAGGLEDGDVVVLDPAAGTQEVIDLEPSIYWAKGFAESTFSADGSTLVYWRIYYTWEPVFSPSPSQVMAVDLVEPEVCAAGGPPAAGAPGSSSTRAAPPGPSWGPFEVSGCWTETSAGVWRAEGAISLNGMDIETTTPGGSITFDTTTGRISSTGVVKVSVVAFGVGGHTVGPFELAREVIDWELDAADVPLTLSTGAFGLPVTASVTVSAPEPGALRFQFDSTLPDLLGGGTVKADVRTSLSTGLVADTLEMTVSGTAVGRLVALDEITYRYDAEKASWRLTGDVADAAGGGSFDGVVAWSDAGVLASADLHVTDVHLGGLVHVEDLRVTFGTATGWKGNLSADGGPEGPAVDASFTYTAGALQAAKVHAERVDLAGLVRVDTFDLTWDKATATWKASGNATVTDVVPALPGGDKPTTLKASLTVTAGVVAAARVRVADATLGGTVRVNHLDIAYDLVDSKPHWVGNADVVLPGPARTRITAAVETLDGQLVKAHAGGTSLGLPLGPGVTLTDASLDVTRNPVWRIVGTATVTAGPVVGSEPALSIDGTAAVTFTDPSLWELSGSLQVASVELATADVRYRSDGRLDAQGHLVWSAGVVGVAGTIAGWATPTAFELAGDASITVAGRTVAGRVVASQVGLAGCATAFESSDLTVGAGVVWETNEIRAFAGSCDLAPWRTPTPASPGPGPGTSAAVLDSTFAVAGGQPAVALRVDGVSGVPQVVIAGPDGTIIDTTAPSGDHHLVVHDTENAAVLVLIEAPATGTWTVTAQTGSPTVAAIAQADALPAPAVAGTVVDQGGGTARLEWTLTPQPGQQVTFSEILADGTGAPITTTNTATGGIAFTPAPGPAAGRRLVATVTQDGLPRATLELGTYTAGVTPPLVSPAGVVATRTGPTTATVTWGAPAGAVAGYEILSLPTGTITTAPSTVTSATVDGLDTGDHTVWVRALGAPAPSPWSDPAPVEDGLPECDAEAFVDVDDDHPFCEDITWLVHAEVTTGYPDGTFRPGIAVTRQGVAAFLFRLTGQTATGTCPGTPFPDVGVTHPFCEEIAWMANEGISTGYSDGDFRPAATITRQSMAAYLYRLAGGTPIGPCDTDFPDVGPTHPFCHAIAWMVDQHITTGYPDGTFRPGVNLTRQSAAAFLHRSETLIDEPSPAT